MITNANGLLNGAAVDAWVHSVREGAQQHGFKETEASITNKLK